jgi:hypothetical protein
MGQIRNANTIFVGQPDEKDQSKDLDADRT